MPNTPSFNSPLTKEAFSLIPLAHELSSLYQPLHNAIRDFPKLEKFSLGITIEKILLRCIESCFTATAVPRGALKTTAVAKASAEFDTLKVYLRLALSAGCLDEKIYLKILPRLGSIGTMLGGWLKEVNATVATGHPNPKPNLPLPPHSKTDS